MGSSVGSGATCELITAVSRRGMAMEWVGEVYNVEYHQAQRLQGLFASPYLLLSPSRFAFPIAMLMIRRVDDLSNRPMVSQWPGRAPSARYRAQDLAAILDRRFQGNFGPV